MLGVPGQKHILVNNQKQKKEENLPCLKKLLLPLHFQVRQR